MPADIAAALLELRDLVGNLNVPSSTPAGLAFADLTSLRAAVPFPDIDPALITIGPFDLGFVTIGPFPIRWYALAYIAGLVLGWRYIIQLITKPVLWTLSETSTKREQAPDKNTKPRKDPTTIRTPGAPAAPIDIDDLLVWATLGVIVGGRAGYVLFYKPSILFAEPLQVFAVWQGGMSFHGGFLGVVIATLLFCRSRALDPVKIGDLLAAAAPIGLFFGRIANFINGELWGHPSDMPWAMVFPSGGPAPRHPSQLYEAGLEGLALFAILWLAIRRFRALDFPGQTMGIFIAGYGAFRTFVEFFREPDAHIGYLTGGFFTMGMLLSLPMVLIGLALIWRTLPGAPAWLAPNAGPLFAPDKKTGHTAAKPNKKQSRT